MKRHTSNEWLDFFGIDVIDPDGWRAFGQDVNCNDQLLLEEFWDRLCQSTVVDNQSELYILRRKVLEFIA